MVDASEPARNTTFSENPSPGQTFYELLEHRPSAWPHIHEGARLQVAMHAWILLSAHDFAAPDDSHVMDVLALAWQDPACRSWMQSQQELWARDRRADFANRLEALAAAVEGLPRLVSIAGLDATPPVWLWYPLIPRGALTLVIGQPATGKTTLLAWLAARLSRGDTLPNYSGHPRPVVRQEPEFVAWYDSESTGGALRRRLEAAGADLDLLRYASPETATTLDAVDAIKADLNAMPTLPALVVFDTLGGFLTGKTALESMSDMRRLLRPLAALADETGTAVVLLHHEGKARRADLMHAGVGSIGIMGAARSALFCGKHPDSEGVYVMLHAKASEEATAQPVAYRLERHELGNGASTVRVELDGVSNVDPLNVVNRPLPESDGDRGAIAEAIQFLENFLSEGPVLKSEILSAARKEGIAPKTLRNAREELRVESKPFEQPGVSRNRWPYAWQLEGFQGCPNPEKGNPGQPNDTRINTNDARVALGCPNEAIGGVGQPKTLVSDTQPESGRQEAKMPPSETCTHEQKRLVESSDWDYWECVDCGAKKVTPRSDWRPKTDPCFHVNKKPYGPFDGCFECLDCEAIKFGISEPWVPRDIEAEARMQEELWEAVERHHGAIG